MSLEDRDRIVFEDVSKFYGEVLGINRVDLSIPRGITSLVGPNGSGKTTLMNLTTGLLQPTRGRIRVLGLESCDPERFFRLVGYCAQYDSFPPGLTGYQFIYSFLRLHGYDPREAGWRTERALEQVGLAEAQGRKVASYSKGMRQRVRLAQAMAHEPRVLVLDEPLNGLDPLARSEVLELFRSRAAAGCHVLISSHILHEVERISDQVVLLNQGHVLAQGEIPGVRSEMPEHPVQISIRCDRPSLLASRVFEQDHAVEIRVHEDGRGLFVRTRNADGLYLLLNRLVLEQGLELESVAPADEDVFSVYEYLIGSDGGSQ